jgi:hypothetical protein
MTQQVVLECKGCKAQIQSFTRIEGQMIIPTTELLKCSFCSHIDEYGNLDWHILGINGEQNKNVLPYGVGNSF